VPVSWRHVKRIRLISQEAVGMNRNPQSMLRVDLIKGPTLSDPISMSVIAFSCRCSVILGHDCTHLYSLTSGLSSDQDVRHFILFLSLRRSLLSLSSFMG